jgi:hypothetical protein
MNVMEEPTLYGILIDFQMKLLRIRSTLHPVVSRVPQL